MAFLAMSKFIEECETIINAAKILGVSEVQIRRYRKMGAIIRRTDTGNQVYIPAPKRGKNSQRSN